MCLGFMTIACISQNAWNELRARLLPKHVVIGLFLHILGCGLRRDTWRSRYSVRRKGVKSIFPLGSSLSKKNMSGFCLGEILLVHYRRHNIFWLLITAWQGSKVNWELKTSCPVDPHSSAIYCWQIQASDLLFTKHI